MWQARSQKFLPVHPRKSFREIWPDVALGFGLKVQAPVPTVPSWQTAHCIFPPKSLAVLEVEPRTQTHYASVLPETHPQAFYLETGRAKLPKLALNLLWNPGKLWNNDLPALSSQVSKIIGLCQQAILLLMPFLTMPASPKHLMISLILFLFSCLFSFDIQSFYFVTLPFVIFSLPISFYILWQFFIYDLVVLFLLHGSSNFIPFQSMESCRVDGVQQDKEQFACLQ